MKIFLLMYNVHFCSGTAVIVLCSHNSYPNWYISTNFQRKLKFCSSFLLPRSTWNLLIFLIYLSILGKGDVHFMVIEYVGLGVWLPIADNNFKSVSSHASFIFISDKLE